MKEITVEEHLCFGVYEVGGLCEKHVSPGRRGPPDRLVTWPDGTMQLVETKRPKGGKLSKPQQFDHRMRAKRNVFVYVLNTKELADHYIASQKCHWDLVV